MLEKGDRVRICTDEYEDEVVEELIGKEGTIQIVHDNLVGIKLDHSVTLKDNRTVYKDIISEKSSVVEISDLEEKIRRALYDRKGR